MTPERLAEISALLKTEDEWCDVRLFEDLLIACKELMRERDEAWEEHERMLGVASHWQAENDRLRKERDQYFDSLTKASRQMHEHLEQIDRLRKALEEIRDGLDNRRDRLGWDAGACPWVLDIARAALEGK